MTVCFTGHRPQSLPFGFNEQHPDCVAIKESLKGEIIHCIESGATDFITGMALGVDMWAAEAVIALKSKYPNIRLIAAIPCPNQAQHWNKESVKRYEGILARCDEQVLVSETYFTGCMHVRNKYMVDHSDTVIAVYNQSESGGTASTVRYAKKKNKKIIFIT